MSRNTFSQEQIIEFQTLILDWFAKNRRSLPWRRGRDPYHIVVSEIMLQQTQVGRVIPKYEAWLKAFPTITSLAQAKTSDVLRLWSGLGYNRRAINLQQFAKDVVAKYKGQIPSDISVLKTLPGIGEYTAGAIACFAFDQQVAVVDTNIRKVIAITFFEGRIPDNKTLKETAEQLLPEGQAYEWNQALMDYSAAMLKKEKVPIPKQSTFIGSDRFYRGKIMKLLINEGSLPIETITSTFRETQDVTADKIETIIQGLVRDQLVISKNGRLYLPE